MTAAVEHGEASDNLEANPTAGRPARPVKQRITLSLPIAIAKKLKDTAMRTQRTYLEVILEGYVDHAESIQSRVAQSESRFEGLAPIRRRWPQGRVQVALLIHATDLGVLDDSAYRARLDRSGYVSELIALL
jgi:hypothetical protein